MGRAPGGVPHAAGLALGKPSHRVWALPSRDVFRCTAAIFPVALHARCLPLSRGFHLRIAGRVRWRLCDKDVTARASFLPMVVGKAGKPKLPRYDCATAVAW